MINNTQLEKFIDNFNITDSYSIVDFICATPFRSNFFGFLCLLVVLFIIFIKHLFKLSKPIENVGEMAD